LVSQKKKEKKKNKRRDTSEEKEKTPQFVLQFVCVSKKHTHKN